MKRSISVLFACILAFTVIGYKTADAKMKKEYLGKWYVTTYKPSDSSQNGHGTSSGRRAKSGRTVAVDHKNPLVKMNKWVYIQGFGKRRVEDYGGFGRYNHGRRAFDVFIENGERGGLFLKKCWVYRPETKKERAIRIAKEKAKERKKRQTGTFIIVFDDSLEPWQIVTDPYYIKKGACISFGGGLYEVVKTKKGLKNKILMNNLFAKSFDLHGQIEIIAEEAVG